MCFVLRMVYKVSLLTVGDDDGREETIQAFLYFNIYFVIQFQQIIGNLI